MNPARGIYEATDTLVEWMSHNLELLQEGTFRYYREAFSLVQIVQSAEHGRVPKYAAYSAIRDYNQEFQSNFSYESIKNLDSTFIFSDFNEWVVFTDRPFDIICGDSDEIEQALVQAPDSVQFIILWAVDTDTLVVYRSPFVGNRESGDLEGFPPFGWGERKGDRETYVLPPEVQASLYAMQRGSILKQESR